MPITLAFFARIGLNLQIFKTALAAAVSWLVATTVLGSDYPFFAPLASILTVQVTVADSVEKATQRIIGIIGGVAVSLLIGHWLSISSVSIFLVIIIGMGISKALRMNPQIVSQVAVSSFLVLAFSPQEQGYAVERVVETLMGSVVAVLINALIVPQNAIPEVENSMLALGEQGTKTLGFLASQLRQTEKGQLVGRQETDALIAATEKSIKSLQLAEQSLKYNPLLTHKRTHLSRLAIGVKRLEHITTQIRGIRRGIADLNSAHIFETDLQDTQALKQAMEATAACITLFSHAMVGPTERHRPALLESIREADKLQNQCLATLPSINSNRTLRDVGSILTDLSRILTEAAR
ncbi:FUSC family protein [Pontibacter anaerobius]|uniref:Aromatic acid exporter family protein n=1 Tax=Pontibacter anaerobius TaxID=2993940 RepID=A0ABT3RFT5_9BACT|nr:aromatic acid exporter family protein [Pontibacter anaerobius]MCX2740301.1 aromatic acid exporter family protein [Pontibacter anaerobius]